MNGPNITNGPSGSSGPPHTSPYVTNPPLQRQTSGPPMTPGGSILLSPRTSHRLVREGSSGTPTPRSGSLDRDAYFDEQDQMRLNQTDSHYWAQHSQLEGLPEHEASQASESSLQTSTGASLDRSSRSEVGSSTAAGPQTTVSPMDQAAMMASLGSNILPAGLESTPRQAQHHNPGSPTQPSSQLQDPLTAELKQLYKSLHKCMELRDKYMQVSLQEKLEDNPRNWDAEYCQEWRKQRGLPAETEDVAGQDVRVDGSAMQEDPDGSSAEAEPKPWRIYPAPPRPHWELFNPPPASSFVVRNQGHRGSASNLPKPIPPASPANAAAAQRLLETTGGQPGVFDMARMEIPGEWKCKALVEGEKIEYVSDANGVYQIFVVGKSATQEEYKRPLDPSVNIPTLRDYFKDLDYLLGVISDGPVKSFAWRRLKYLEGKWNLYSLMNEGREVEAMKRVRHRDFYNVRKVDTHVHHSASMNQKHLLRFIKAKIKRYPDDVVIYRDGHHLTLEQVFASLNLTAYDLSIDTLDMHAHREAFHRFDKFNLKYNPIGESRLREIFLKTDNFIGGRYLAEITKEIFADLESSKYQMAEYRISIYGRSRDEWDKLAAWVVDNQLFSPNVRWLIQVPRLYEVYKGNGTIDNFQDLLANIFEPLLSCTMNPQKHPKLHILLQRVIGFDLVDDESKVERRYHRKFPPPSKWNMKESPPYTYWIYYMFANMASLNQLRRARGFSTLVLRPHSGEAGDTDHLAAAYLSSQAISHGIMLRKVPAMQYLFYLKQVALAMSPLSNNALFLHYDRNPFPAYLRMGMNVSISTDDPLQFHLSKEPLLEEYSVATQVYRLSACDMCELARNSVLQSGWEREIKRHWLGNQFHLPGPQGNVTAKTNVPDIRLRYRWDTLKEELELIQRFGGEAIAPISTPSGMTGSHNDVGLGLVNAGQSAGNVSGGVLETVTGLPPTAMSSMSATVGKLNGIAPDGASTATASASSFDETSSNSSSDAASNLPEQLDLRDFSGVSELAQKIEKKMHLAQQS